MANPLVLQINEELENLQKELGQFRKTVDYLNNAKNDVAFAVQSVNQAEEYFAGKVEELKSTYTAFIKLTDSISGIVSKIETINFPERLDKIEDTVQETITYLNETRAATLDELQKASEIITKADFEGRFKNLQTAINSSIESNNNLAGSIENQKLPEKLDNIDKDITQKIKTLIADLQKNTKQIADETANSIHELNLPVRMDKLDANIAGILAAIQNVQSRIESVERNIGEKLKDSTEKQSSMLTQFQDKIIQSMVTLNQELKATAKKQKTNTYITWVLIVLGTIAIIIFSKLN
jgi:ABC-type transporter Mla subunit MlaD